MRYSFIHKKGRLCIILSIFLLAATLSSCAKNTVESPTASAGEFATVPNNTIEADSPQSEADDVEEEPAVEEDTSYDITLSFAGDINLDDTWVNMVYYHNHGDVLEECIDPVFIDAMCDADVMWINNEFSYSDRGTPLSGKAYTFRANPENVNMLKEMGGDIVGLANNHVYDYGKDAIEDTFETLENANIPYVGAGRTLSDAMKPVYFEVDGKKIAYVAASRAEKYKMTPQATETEPGILRCYDPALFVESIREADENADFVIALPHWGTEYSTVLEPVQTETARLYIDAGADVVIGAHSHCLQGIGYYDGKPIFYSLGNYWFNEKTLDTMLLTIHISGDSEDDPGTLSAEILPGTQAGCVTKAADTEEERERIFRYMESISTDISIRPDGVVEPNPTGE